MSLLYKCVRRDLEYAHHQQPTFGFKLDEFTTQTLPLGLSKSKELLF
jgi:hypothetical protein